MSYLYKQLTTGTQLTRFFRGVFFFFFITDNFIHDHQLKHQLTWFSVVRVWFTKESGLMFWQLFSNTVCSTFENIDSKLTFSRTVFGVVFTLGTKYFDFFNILSFWYMQPWKLTLIISSLQYWLFSRKKIMSDVNSLLKKTKHLALLLKVNFQSPSKVVSWSHRLFCSIINCYMWSYFRL